MQLLGEFSQHAGAEIGAALGQESALAVGRNTHADRRIITDMQRPARPTPPLVFIHASG